MWIAEAVRLGHEVAQIKYYDLAQSLLRSKDGYTWAAALALQEPEPPITVHGVTGAFDNGWFILTAGSNVAASTSTNRATQIYEPQYAPSLDR